MELTSLVLAPIRVPMRIVKALDDLATLADRAQRDPDPVEQARDRLDLLMVELAALVREARNLIDGGAELTQVARQTHATMFDLLQVGRALLPTTLALEATGERIRDGGEDLTAVALQLHVDTRELIDGGERLTATSEQLEEHLRIFRAALPRMLEGLDTVEHLEDAVETVAETIEPLQGAAERVGRVTQRLGRR
jgi:methyl-accepting chemotaxis protein